PAAPATVEPPAVAAVPVQTAPAPTMSDDAPAGPALHRVVEAQPSVGSRIKQLAVGLWAMTLPRFVGETLGLFHVGGGGGKMWLFVEFDTIFFDVVILFAAVALYQALKRGGWRSPALAFTVSVTFGMTAALAYTITNFGTMFRHRAMVMIGLVMIPLIVAAELSRDREARADGEEAVAEQ
ncbi:MAG: hypothetical protein M3Q69_14000, partial [Acidobacteriota bacterium]|nr:hypothetical protein [Acidobacteriota bacterium]